jgi:hypothetical protein
LQHRGSGDVGPALQLEQADGAVLYSHRRLSTRSLTTVFGTVELVRIGYSRPSAPSIVPLDKALALPARSFSYELQRRLVKAAVQNPFLESVQTIAELTGVSVSKRSLEEILRDAARDFDAFYQQRSVATRRSSRKRCVWLKTLLNRLDKLSTTILRNQAKLAESKHQG